MTKFPIMLYNTKNTKKALVPPIPPPSSYEDAVGWSAIEAGYKTALRGSRKFTREAVLYDLYSEVNNVRLWRDLKKIEKTRQAGVSEYTPGKYRHRIIVEPKERSLHIPPLRDKVVQLVIHQELQTLFRPVFVNRSFACMYGKGPIRAAFNVQHDMRVARMKWGDEATVIKIDVRKFFYSIDRSVLKQIIAKRFKKLKKKYPEKYEDFLRFYRLLCKVIDSSPEGERGIPLGNVSSQDFANIYLNELDQFCIRFLGATLYTRYMDDVVVIAPNKEIAREWLAKIKVFLQERLHLETNQKTKIFYVRQGVNAYGFKIKATHLLLRTESKRREKRRIKRMMEKLQEGTITKAAIVQSVNSWLGFARWACAYNLAKKIFAPYRFIKTEGELPYVNSRLASRGIPVACEVDIYGALSEYIGACITGDAITLLDINNSVPKYIYDEDIAGKFPYDIKDTFMGFHCGNTPSCKMCGGCAVKYQLIQNRLLENGGTPDFTRGTLEGDIAPGAITFYRLQCDSEGELRAYVAEGEVLPVATRSFGGIGIFAIPEMGRFYRHVLIQKRYPHHGAVAFAHCGKALFEVLKYFGISDIAYNQPKSLPYATENPWG